MTKTCTKCQQEKPLTEFRFNKTTGRSLSGKCKHCYAQHCIERKGGRQLPYKPHINAEETKEMIRLYVEEKKGVRLIGRHFGRTQEAIRKALKRNGVAVRSHEEANQLIKERCLLTPEQKQERNKRKSQRDKDIWGTIVAKHLVGSSCQDCGNDDWTILQFDHVDPTSKESGISDMIGRSQKKIEAELNKCEIVCPNCHAKRTAKMFGSWRLSYAS